MDVPPNSRMQLPRAGLCEPTLADVRKLTESVAVGPINQKHYCQLLDPTTDNYFDLLAEVQRLLLEPYDFLHADAHRLHKDDNDFLIIAGFTGAPLYAIKPRNQVSNEQYYHQVRRKLFTIDDEESARKLQSAVTKWLSSWIERFLDDLVEDTAAKMCESESRR